MKLINIINNYILLNKIWFMIAHHLLPLITTIVHKIALENKEH